MDVNLTLGPSPSLTIDTSAPATWGTDVVFKLHWDEPGPLNLRNGWVFFRHAIDGVWTDGVRWPPEGGHIRLSRTTQSRLFSSRIFWRPDDVVQIQASAQVPGYSVMETTASFTVPRPPMPDLEAYNEAAAEEGEPLATGFEWDSDIRAWVPVLAADVPEWAPDVFYGAGAEASYQGIVYVSVTPHTSQAGWEPPNAPALWAPK